MLKTLTVAGNSKRFGRLLKNRSRDVLLSPWNVILSAAKDLIYLFSGTFSECFKKLALSGQKQIPRSARNDSGRAWNDSAMPARSQSKGLRMGGGVLAAALVFAAAASAAQQKAQTAPPPVLPSRIAPQAQKLLDTVIQALGGEAFLHYQSIATTGHVFSISQGQTAGYFPFKSTEMPPDKRRFSYGKGKPVILINNGDQGWEMDNLGRTHQNPEQKRGWEIANRYSLDNLFRYRIHEPGVLILASGVDFVDNQPVEVVDIIDAQNVKVKLYLRRSTHLPVRITYRVQNPNNREWEDYADDYSDYQSFQGITTPMHVIRYLDDERIGELFRRTVSYNQAVPANYFDRPQ